MRKTANLPAPDLRSPVPEGNAPHYAAFVDRGEEVRRVIGLRYAERQVIKLYVENDP
jgi:uncharacterized DUF497 family protein